MNLIELSKAPAAGESADEKFLVNLDNVVSIKPAESGSTLTFISGVTLNVAETYEQLKATLDVQIWNAPSSRLRAVA